MSQLAGVPVIGGITYRDSTVVVNEIICEDLTINWRLRTFLQFKDGIRRHNK